MSYTPTPIDELKRMTPQELRKELQVKRAECARMRISIEMGAEKNHAVYKTMRRDVARMTMTLGHMPKTAPVVKEAKKTVAKASQTKPKSVKSSRSNSKK